MQQNPPPTFYLSFSFQKEERKKKERKKMSVVHRALLRLLPSQHPQYTNNKIIQLCDDIIILRWQNKTR